MLYQDDNLLGMRRPTRLAVDEENGRDLIGFDDGSLAWSRSDAVWAFGPDEPTRLEKNPVDGLPPVKIEKRGYIGHLHLKTITFDGYAITAVCDRVSGQWYVEKGSFRKGE